MVGTNQVRAQGVMTWLGVIGENVIGPYFFENNVDAESYVTLHALGYDPWNVWFQHDGASAHTAYITQDFLEENFNNWIGRGGTIDWPARSCDLNPLVISIWSFLKYHVYQTSPLDLNDVKTRVTEATNRIPANMLNNICRNLDQRLHLCQAANGGHFENFM